MRNARNILRDNKKSLFGFILTLSIVIILVMFVPIAVRASVNFLDKPNKKDFFQSEKKQKQEYVPDELIIKFKDKSPILKKGSLNPQNTGIRSVNKLNKKYHVKRQERLFKIGKNEKINRFGKTLKSKKSLENIYKLSLPKKTDIKSVMGDYKNDPNVEYAEPNFIVETTATVPNDPYNGSQWHLNNTGQTVNDITGKADADINAPGGWGITTGSNQTVIAILDTGIDYNHEDLDDKIWINSDEIPGNNIDDDSNGYIDDERGYDFIGDNYYYSSMDNNPFDSNGHGTFVSGLAAAETNNNQGIAGVDWHARLMAVKVMNKWGSGTSGSLVDGIYYAVNNGAHVINMSLGASGTIPQTIKEAIDYAEQNGVISVAAAGNSNSTVGWPANYEPVIAVGAVDQNDQRTWWSNYGTKLDVVASGKNMTSTDITGSGGYSDGNYSSGPSGTSFSSPVVAGIVSLIFALNSNPSNDEIRNYVFNYADDKSDLGYDYYYGYGRVNLKKSLERPQLPADILAPKVTITNPLTSTNTCGNLSINATIDDRKTGNSKISEALYSVDAGSFYPMNARDGNYSSPAEDVTVQLDTTNFPNGEHTITVVGKDSANNSTTSTITINIVNGTSWDNPSVIIANPLDNAFVHGELNIIAIVDDRNTGNTNISEAQYSIDSGAFNPMNPQDGSYDSPIEKANANLDTNVLSNGVHSLTVQTKDINNNWGIETIAINIANGLPWDGPGAYMNRVSIDSQGNEANGRSGSYGWPSVSSISSDGKFVAFESSATNLVVDDTNGKNDIFVKNLQTGEVKRASTDSQGNQANRGSSYGGSYKPSISSDGRYVAFESYASNLVPGDTNYVDDVFRKDMQTGEIIRVNTDSQGNQADDEMWYPTDHPSISSDGRYVAFRSIATNLVAEDINEVADIFRKDLQTGEMIIVSTDSQVNQANDESWSPSISSDGRYIAFESEASNLIPGGNGMPNIYRKDLQTGEVVLISTDTQGNQANGSSWCYPSISSDGSYVSFISDATNLVTGDTNDSADVFMKDLQTGETIRASTDLQGNTYGDCWFNSISSDGRYVTFATQQIFRKDLWSGAVIQISMNSQSNQANNSSWAMSASPDGRYVAFESYANNLIPGDTNGVKDIFVADTNHYPKPLELIINPSQPNGNNNWYKTTVPTIRLLEPGSTFYYSWNTTNSFNIYTSAFTAPEGENTLYYYSTDIEGNIEPIKSQSFKVDATDPKFKFDSKPQFSYVNGNLVLSMIVTDSISGVQEVGLWSDRLYDQSGKLISTTFIKNYCYTPPYSFTLDTTKLTDGKHIFNLVCQDNAGNGFNTQMYYYIDNTNPITSMGAYPAPGGDNGWYKSNIPTISFSSNESGKTYYSWNTTDSFNIYKSAFTAPEGENTLYYYSTDKAGNQEVLNYQQIKVDATAPSIASFTVPTLSTNVSPSLGFSISWNGFDNSGGSGIAAFQIRYRSHTTTAWSTLKFDGKYWTSKKSTGFVGKPGCTYYFKVRAKDKAGHISNWSTVKYTIVPYNDSALTYSSGWSSVTQLTAYNGSLKYSNIKGSYSKFIFTGKSVTLIAPMGLSKGNIDVYIRDEVDGIWSSYTKVKSIDLYSSIGKNRVPITIKSWSNSSTHQIKLVATGTKNMYSKGTRVDIDGIGVLK